MVIEAKNSAGIRRFSYNSRHQQTRVETETGSVQENRYDAEGLRFELLENGRRTSFVYHDGELLQEEGREEQGTSYHLGAGMEAFRRGQELSYYHRDEQLSTVFVTDGQGEIRNSYQYDAFGIPLDTTEQLNNRIRYTGQQYDELTEQYYLRARYYNPVAGRFMQEDVYQGDGLNLYAYCGNNPVMYDDPSGYASTSTGKACPPQGKISESVDGSGSSSIVEIVDEEKGTFIIKDWSDYPDDYVPVPDQNKVWTFLEGDEYNSARDSANIFNRNMRAADPYYANNGLEIHEIEPVKMGGSPTDINNKTAIQSQVHRRYVTPWWNKIRDEVKKGLN